MNIPQSQVFALLHARFHLESFRYPQYEIITTLVSGRDVLALLPTGAGKSLCYQLPACLFPNLTIVISPLLSLMNDQVTKLKKIGIAATALTSQKSARQRALIRSALSKQKIKLLYVSPETLISVSWFKLLTSLSVDLLVIDEAHCIEMWGSEFRPAYLHIKKFIAALSSRPIVAALTATATPKTVNYIIQMLGLKLPHQFQLSTRKSHLHIIVQPCHHTTDKLLTLISYLRTPARLPAIIYCSTRGAVNDVASWLRLHYQPFFPHLVIAAYHGGLSTQQRIACERQFITNHADILVATNAFGMGVDKPNTRTVFHWQLPASIENFYQEIGRAGRDLQPAISVLCYSPNDELIQQKLNANKNNNSSPQKLHQLLHLVKSKICINQQLEKYFNDPNQLPRCGHCSACLPTQPLNHQVFELAKQLLRVLNHQRYFIPTPISTIELLSVLQPTLYSQLTHVPGIGQGWIRKHASAVLALCRIHQSNLLIEAGKHPIIQSDFPGHMLAQN